MLGDDEEEKRIVMDERTRGGTREERRGTIIGVPPHFYYLQKSDRSSCYETCQRHDKKILSDPKNRSIH